MSAKYKPAPEVEELGRKLISTVERHEFLEGVRVEFVFIDKAPRSKGRDVLGRARKIGGLTAFLAGSLVAVPDGAGFLAPDPFFLIEISHDYWIEVLSELQKVALVDHELCHLRVDHDEAGEVSLSTCGHDVEEFACVVERHGLWSDGLTGLGRVMSEQLSLAIDKLETS